MGPHTATRAHCTLRHRLCWLGQQQSGRAVATQPLSLCGCVPAIEDGGDRKPTAH